MYDRDWYNKVPIAEINKLIESTGWDVRKIFSALQIQEHELKVKESEALHKLLKYHWEEPEYKPLSEELDLIKKQITSLGSVDESIEAKT